MNEETRTTNASCLCRRSRHQMVLPLSEYPLEAYSCHCDSCRHCTGTLCLTMALMPRTYEPTQTLLRKLQLYQSSQRITRFFCPICGTKVFIRFLVNTDDPLGPCVYGVPTGTLEGADGVFRILGHKHVQDTLDGGLSDFIPSISGAALARWPEHFGEHKQLPLYWASSASKSKPKEPIERLRAHCKCRRVEFWIARPSHRSTLAEAAQPDLLAPYAAGKSSPSATENWWLRDNHSKFLAGVCACNSCRLASGMEWVQWAFIPTTDISLDADGKVPLELPFASLRCYQSSAQVKRYFCGNCGAMIFWDGETRPMIKDVAVGLLDASEGARAESWLEWSTGRLSFREDTLERAESLTLGMESGLAEYGKRAKD